MTKLSIIVPIYNVEEYLDECIKLLRKQTLEDIEIILVNDGSSDNSLSICNMHASKDNRIKVIDKNNEGVSIARNKGIEVATSEYIAFMDPDDKVALDMYEKLYTSLVKNKCDIILCNYKKIDKYGEEVIYLPFEEGIYKKESIEYILMNMIGNISLEQQPIMGSVWRGIYKKSLINKYNIRFPENIRPMQDLIFITNYLSKCNTMYIDKNPYYYYCVRANSGVTGYKKDVWNNNKKVCKLLEEILKENELLDKSKIMLDNRWVNTVLSAIGNEAHKDNKNKLIEKIKVIKMIIEDECIASHILSINYEELKLRKKFLIKCIKNKYVFLMYIYFYISIRLKSNY